MWKSRFSLWITGPTILVSLLLLALCCLAAVALYKQQANSASLSAEILDENVNSTQVAHDLKNTLTDLVLILPDAQDQPEPLHLKRLHQRIREQLGKARTLADKEEERKLVGELEDCLGTYFRRWKEGSREAPDARITTVAECKRILEDEALPRCKELRTFNAEQIRKSEQAHDHTVNLVISGLLSIGVIGALAGLLFGYGVARRLRHSIYHLRVRVQDAASKLGQDLPAVAVDEDGDLHEIQEQMQSVVRDIEQVVQKLQQRDREVLRAEQLAALGQLAAGVAHEIRNPLTSIKLLVQTLREDLDARGIAGEEKGVGTLLTERPATAFAQKAPDPLVPATEDLQIIELEIRRMERCLQTFLDYARPPKPDFKPLDLCQPISRTLSLISGRARKQHVAFEFEPPPAALMVTADAEQLQQLLVNLTLNALDAMPRGGTLRIELHELTNHQVELTVRDTGPGIASKLLPALFQPFVSTKDTGLGLGLVTSRRIAESHGGTLQASNLANGGACFTLRLPKLPEKAAVA